MRKVFNILAVAVLALMVCACGGSLEVKGYVVGKRHTPEHTTRHYQPKFHRYVTTHHSEEWVLYVADSIRVHPVHVDSATFQNAAKGEHIRLKCGE